MSRISSKPIYLVPADDPAVPYYGPAIEAIIANDTKYYDYIVPPEAIKENDVYPPQGFVLALQHYPQAIERLLFGIDLKFQEIADSELYLHDGDWKNEPKYMKWFHTMGQMHVMLFFLRDREARFYTLAGDLLANGEVKIEDTVQASGKIRARYAFTPEQAMLLAKRLGMACWMLLLYCHGSGFYPKTYIESVLADFDLPVHYDRIYKQYITDVKKGIQLQARGTQNP